MEPTSLILARRLAVALVSLAVVAIVAVIGMGRAGAISWEDVTAAEAELSAAQNRLAAIEADITELDDERTRLLTSIDRLEAREAEIAERAEGEGASIRDRIARIYMAHGALSFGYGEDDLGDVAARTAYVGAVSERDQELVNEFAVTVVDLISLRATATERLADNAADVEALQEQRSQRAGEVDAARSRLSSVRGQWEAFQEAQRIAAEEELRRQEESANQEAAPLASGGGDNPGDSGSGTTAPAAPPTTTTSVPWNPSAGVSQWAPLVTEVFTKWGLNQTECATRNGIEFCVGPQVENALRIIQCESTGNPMAVNSSSGTSGLFQNHPLYWQGRVDRVRSQHASKHPDMPADASIFNPEYNIAVAALLVYESKQVILGQRGGGGIGGVSWPEFNFDMYYNGSPQAYGYSVYGKGPNPWGHWVGCAAARGTNMLGDSGPPYTYASGQNLYDSGWIHPWAQQQSPP